MNRCLLCVEVMYHCKCPTVTYSIKYGFLVPMFLYPEDLYTKDLASMYYFLGHGRLYQLHKSLRSLV